MGGQGAWVQSSGFSPNGLLPNESSSVSQLLDPERWSEAEERTAELIARIQPNQPSEERRQAIASYVQRLITKCFSCQVFTFGSVPLKTYLPDGDIDLTAFSKKDDLKDNWANEVQDMLKREEKSENAEFHVTEVQCIQAEVKIIKCLVENIVVDISFNQLGGLCTLCFLEEVNQLISQIHLFKRSIILIKAWCYYESRILGAHHGLISTYALETLVLYIFHVYNNSFSGPLEVLYRFLQFFSKFDWENFCVSLWGPVPISSLPDMTGKPPLKDGGELLLSKVFLDACSSVYAVFPGGMENQEQPFVSKYFNVIDPLRRNNNLGRSVSKGNFFRIRSAFAFGAQRLARLLDCSKENIIAEVNQFFSNTWDRHGKGHCPDVYGSRGLNLSQVRGSDTLRNDSNIKAKENGASSDSEADLSYVCQLAMYQFARTHSSLELADTCTEVLSQGRHNSYYSECGLSSRGKEHLSVADTIQMHRAEQDIVNMMASSTGYSFGGQVDVPGYESASVCGSNPLLPGSASGQKAKDGTGDLPFTFYPTGPPVPFLTMLPLYNAPIETGTSTMSTNHSDRDKELNNFHKSKLDHNLDLAMNGAGKSHILNGDFTGHWQNLQYGRLCQNSQHYGVAYTPPVTPISSLQPASVGPAGVYQLYGDEIPRYRGGTGTYLSNPKISSRDNQSLHTRNLKGSNSYDREGNGNMNTKSRFAGRGQGRAQREKPSARVERSTASNSRFSKPLKLDQVPSYQSRSNSTTRGSGSSGYGTYGLPLVNPAEIHPSICMLYPYDQNVICLTWGLSNQCSSLV